MPAVSTKTEPSSDEWQSRREAPDGKDGVAVSCSELLRRGAEGGDEEAVGFPELAAYRGADDVEERRGRSLRVPGTAVGTLTQNRRGSERLASRSRPLQGGLLVDLMDQMESTGPPDRFRKILPARERREVERLDARILETVEALSPQE
jgi:hypothetical protein